jgi:hypothetical protein
MDKGTIIALLTLAVLVLVLVAAERAFNALRGMLKPAGERALLARAKAARPQGAVNPNQRAAFKGCANCGSASLTLPYRDAGGRTYCSEECLIWGALGPTEFCQGCVRGTTAKSTGNMNRLNGTGRSFIGGSQRCPRCRSMIRRVWFTLLYVPLIPLSRYRVIHSSPREFFARQLAQ